MLKRVHRKLIQTGLRAAVCVGLCAALGGGAGAQESYGIIQGEVINIEPGGERFVVPGAQVTRVQVGHAGETETKSRPVAETSSDENGKFVFEHVPGGCYQIVATSPGMNGAANDICLLVKGAVVELTLEMKLEVVKQSIDVKASVDGLDTTDSSASGAVGSKTLEHAPLMNERFEDVMPLLPGLVRGPDGLINMKGSRSAQSGSLVNSANVTDPVTGNSAIELPVDVVSSVKVLANPYDSEYGKFAGAVSSVETETADFQKLRFQVSNILPWFRSRDGRLAGIGSLTPRLTVSAPLVRGKVAMTQSFQYRFVRTQVERAGLPELESDTKIEGLDSFTQFDFQISSRHTAGVSLSIYPQKRDYLGLDTFTPQASTSNFHQRGFLFSGHDTYVFPTGALLRSQMSFKTFDADVKANSNDSYRQGIETTTGGYFNLQNRETFRYELSEVYHFAPWRAFGQHMFKLGFNFVRNTYDGRQKFDPVDILGIGDRLVEQVEFTDPARVRVRQNEYTAFAHDQWNLLSRLSVDLGLRYDRDSVAHENNVAPRAGFVYALTADNRTTLRGGIGIYYNRVALNVPTFTQLPERTETRFTESGDVSAVFRYRHRFGTRIRNPRSLSWSLQLDREVIRNLFIRTGFQQRNTTRDFVLEPESTSTGEYLTLSNIGRNRYREFEVTARYLFPSGGQITGSYVRSSAIGDLNDFNQFFGNSAAALVRPNERSRLPFDAPDRFLFWADLKAPWEISVAPSLDIHSGFPYSAVDEQRDFVGPRNQAGRFPTFLALDLQAVKQITLPFTHEKYKADVGVRVFNLLNTTNPLDLQNNLASPNFGLFTNFKNREWRGKFVMHF